MQTNSSYGSLKRRKEFKTANLSNLLRETRSHTPQVVYSEWDASSHYSGKSQDMPENRYQTLPLGPTLKTSYFRRDPSKSSSPEVTFTSCVQVKHKEYQKSDDIAARMQDQINDIDISRNEKRGSSDTPKESDTGLRK